jgi:hypothetical protein
MAIPHLGRETLPPEGLPDLERRRVPEFAAPCQLSPTVQPHQSFGFGIDRLIQGWNCIGLQPWKFKK